MEMRRAFVWMVWTLCLVAVTTACSGPAESTAGGKIEGKLVLTGASTVAPLVAEIAQRFEALHPGVRVDVQTGGSSRGIADAESGVADLGMSSRGLKSDEAERLIEHPIALDGVAFMVHGSNPVTALDDRQLRAIYTGEIENWSQLGGPDLAITVVQRAAGRSEVELIGDYLSLPSTSVAADLVAGENQQAIKSVIGDPSAIVYLSIGAAQREIDGGAPLRLLPLGGVPATAQAVASGEFPLIRPLLLLSRGEPADLAAEFLAFARSSNADDLIHSLAYVPPRRG